MDKIVKIEQDFANDLASPNFTILANYYLQNKQFNHALKICKIGLSQNPENQVGEYIYAKTLLIIGQTKKAEKYLKNIVEKNVYHLRSLLLLIEVMKFLKRSNNVIKKYVQISQTLFPKHPKILQLCQSFNIEKNTQIKTHNKTSYPKTNKFILNNSLATETMYKLFIEQKAYSEALGVLEILFQNNKQVKLDYKIEKNKLLKKIQKGPYGTKQKKN